MTDPGPDTIFALASGAGRSAVAIVRLSGPGSRFALETIAGTCPAPRQAVLRKLRHPVSHRLLDEALVLFFAGPRSETGEDCAEFQLHGSRAVVRSVVDALAELPGFRAADPGEFALRALRNGKIDLLGLESLADLIDSDTELQRQQAIEGGGRALRDTAEAWRQMLIDVHADLAAEIDFADEDDVSRHLDSTVERTLMQLQTALVTALDRSRHAEQVREGFRVALVGRPNSGKSSLINALAGRDVAIVSAVPGTTRDRIEIALDLAGMPVIVTDTAGLHETTDVIEQEGMRRSVEAGRAADLVLWLVAPGEGVPLVDASFAAEKVRVLATKSDCCSDAANGTEWHRVSVFQQDTIDGLIAKIADLAVASFGGCEPGLITRSRQRALIEMAVGEVSLARSAVGSIEMCAEHVRLATVALDRLVGRVDIEDVLGAVFSRFCVGK